MVLKSTTLLITIKKQTVRSNFFFKKQLRYFLLTDKEIQRRYHYIACSPCNEEFKGTQCGKDVQQKQVHVVTPYTVQHESLNESNSSILFLIKTKFHFYSITIQKEKKNMKQTLAEMLNLSLHSLCRGSFLRCYLF